MAASQVCYVLLIIKLYNHLMGSDPLMSRGLSKNIGKNIGKNIPGKIFQVSKLARIMKYFLGQTDSSHTCYDL